MEFKVVLTTRAQMDLAVYHDLQDYENIFRTQE